MNVNLDGFDVVVIDQVGEITKTVCYKKYSDYKKDLITEEMEETVANLSVTDLPFLDVDPRCCKDRAY